MLYWNVSVIFEMEGHLLQHRTHPIIGWHFDDQMTILLLHRLQNLLPSPKPLLHHLPRITTLPECPRLDLRILDGVVLVVDGTGFGVEAAEVEALD